MRLFQIKDVTTRKPLPETYESKTEAKIQRAALNGDGPLKYIVVPGPDHRNYKK